MEGNNILTLRRIGTFLGSRIREIHEALANRVTKTELADALASIVQTYQFPETLDLIIAHNSGKVPVSVSITDLDGRVHHAAWRVLDTGRLQVTFTEAVSGWCSVIFRS